MLSKVPSLAAAGQARLGVSLSQRLAAQARQCADGGKEEHSNGESTYEQMKRVASQSGNPAKEWMQGTKERAAAYSDSAEQMYEATKRATQDITTHAKEAMARGGLKDVKQMACNGSKGAGLGAAAASVGAKLSAVATRASEAVDEALGDPHNVPSARAQFEASRSEEQRAATNKDRKSQLTDEAAGDNPAETRTRDEHQILPNEFYTRH